MQTTCQMLRLYVIASFRQVLPDDMFDFAIYLEAILIQSLATAVKQICVLENLLCSAQPTILVTVIFGPETT